ncbi:MAG: glycosyltransferase family 39 protein [Deltaproteobacteria bacterium]|nr:glycosyltransferase family 39 protein [Deltaproteobacteria bacterium]
MSRGFEKRVVIAWLALAACAFVALRAPLLALPLERDEGEYAYIAWRMQEGDVPYRDAFDQKPPGTFAAYWLAFETLGRNARSPRLLMHLWSLATAAVLFLLVRNLVGRLAGAGAVLVFAALSADPRVGAASANTEAFLLLPMVAALACVLCSERRESAASWLAAGALSALAVAFKQVAVTNAAYVCVLALLLPGHGPRWRRAAALAAGATLVVAPLIGAFVAAGAGEAFVDAVVVHNFEYASRRSFAEGLAALRHGLASQAPSFALAWLLAGWALLCPGLAGRRSWGLLGGWLLASSAGVAIGWQFRPHYFVQALPALAACAGVALASAVQALHQRARGAALGAALALGLALVALPALANRAVLTAATPEAAARRLWGMNPFAEAAAIARHIARTSSADESVFVVGSEPQIFFYAERRSATRYIFFYPLTGGYPAAAGRQREAMAEVVAARPRYVVWVHVPTSLLVSERTERWIFDESERLLAQGYGLELVAHPDESGEDYVLARGQGALAWVGEARESLDVTPWVAVYRRAR